MAEDNQVTQPEIKDTEAQSNEVVMRPDPRFKQWTERLLKALGIQTVATDLPQLLSADMILQIPLESHAKLVNTLLDFLRQFRYAVMDFKGQGDNLNLDKFLTNVARTATFCTKVKPNEDKRKVLNLIVSSRRPEDLLTMANEDPDNPEFTNTPEMPWLWRGGTFYQKYIIIVCRDLPLEEPYYDWLIFAPSDSDKWKNFVKIVLREKRQDLLDELILLHPKETKMITAEYFNELDPEQQQMLYGNYEEVVGEGLSFLEEKAPQRLPEILAAKVSPERLAEVLASKPVMSNLTAEQVMAALTPEQLEAIRKALAETAPAQPIEKPSEPKES